jgi:prolyl-tRNA synthetase
MQYSKLFGKSVKENVRGAGNVSTELLYRGGFIRESVAGRYFLLPLGFKVHDKIVSVIREEMNKVGGQEMVSPVLHPLELWKETNRTNTTGFELMKVKDRRGAEFALGGTAEEMFVDVVRKFQLSYKDLPFNIYQFSTKFRDELRARGGLLRVREFTMKDAYSFDASPEEFGRVYEKMKSVYKKIFSRLGLETYVVEADNGYIGGEYCHEFVVESEVGESRFFVSEDGEYCAHEDVAKFKRVAWGDDEQMEPLKVVEQPEWVQNMDDFEKHYKVSRSRCLKNVVYKNRVSGEMVIATLTGDLEVNKTKLEHALGVVGQLEDATEEDLNKMGTKRGYVHSWGHKATYVGDEVLPLTRNLIGGQKEETTDTYNVNYGRDFKCDIIADIAMAQPGYKSESGKELVEKKGIEVGNIFQLGYHYTKLMKGAEFTDADGMKKPFYMGCYGIGIGRTMATIVEKFHDEKGIMWNPEVAPFRAHLINLGSEEEYSKAQRVYEKLMELGIEVLWDEREGVSAGAKFADCDLIGIPVRLVISSKTGDLVEWKQRSEGAGELVNIDEIVLRLKKEKI